MTSCIFCKISDGRIPKEFVYKDKNFLAFLDIQPVSHGHILIIPKEHIVWMYEMNDEALGEIFKLTKKIMLALKKSLKCDYVQVWVSGEEIPHFHIHLLPRFSDDGLPNPPRKKYIEGQEKVFIEKITQVL